MLEDLIKWDIYEIRTLKTSVNGVMLRGRIRKFCLNRKQNVLAENTEDIEKSVRFALISGEESAPLINYLLSIISDATIKLVRKNILNPTLSKLKVNIEDRYTL